MSPLRLAPAAAKKLAAAAGVSVPDPPARKTRVARPEIARGLDTQCKALGLPIGVPEFQFHETRKWRSDRAWLDQRVLVEIEGGHFATGRHTRGRGFQNDCIKYAEAMVRGWRVLRVTTDMVKDGSAVGYLARLLGVALTKHK